MKFLIEPTEHTACLTKQGVEFPVQIFKGKSDNGIDVVVAVAMIQIPQTGNGALPPKTDLKRFADLKINVKVFTSDEKYASDGNNEHLYEQKKI